MLSSLIRGQLESLASSSVQSLTVIAMPGGVESSFDGETNSGGLFLDSNPELDSSRPPQPGRCGDFDGLNDYISSALNPAVDIPDGCSVEFWVKPDVINGAGQYYRVFTIGTSGGATRLSVCFEINQLQLLGTGGAQLITVPAAINTWYHVVAVSNFNNSHTFYVNGVKIGTDTSVIDFSDSTVLRVGCDTNVSPTRFFDGKLSHFRVWGIHLTGIQVRDLYLNGPKNSLSRDSLELEYLLENQHSNFVFDSSGAERHASKIGVDASVGQFHHEGSSVPFSDENERGYTQLAWFDGVDDRIVISNNAVTDGFFPMEDYTLEIEAVRDNFNFQPFFHLSDPDNLNKYIQFKFPNQLMMTFSAGMAEHTATTLIAPYSTAGVGFGQLFTVKAVIRQGFQGLYVNDVLMASKDLVGTFVFNDSMLTLGFGQTSGANTAYSRSLVKSIKLTDNLTSEVKLHLDFSTLKDGKSIVDSSTGKVYAIEGADSRFMQRIPAATATTDASGGKLTYAGEVAKPAKYKQSWCGNFDGLNDYIQFNNFVDASLLEQGRATVRIKTDDGGYTTIFGFGNTDDSIVVGLDSGMVWLAALQNQYNDFIYKETPAIISNGVEYLIEVSWGNGNYSIKVDGVLQPLVDWSSETISGDSVVLANNTPLVIGADTFDAGSLSFDGQIFDLQIYDKNGDLFSHVPICEGVGSPVVFDVITGGAGVITGADITVGGTFWGRQDSYHYNAVEGYRVLENQGLVSHLMPSWVGQSMSWTAGADDPFGGTKAMRLAHTNTVTGTHRIYRSGQGATNGDHMVFWIKPDNLATHNTLYLQWTGGAGSYYNLATRTFESGLYSDFRHDTYGDWHRLSWVMDNVGTDVLQISIMPSGQPYTVVTPVNTTDGASIYYGFVANKELADPYPGNQETSIKVPQTAYGWSSTIGPSWRPPDLHNGAESGIDWTGGVAFPQPALPSNLINPANILNSNSTVSNTSEVSFAGLTAKKLVEDSTASTTRVWYSQINTGGNLVAGQPYTLTVIAKAGTRSWITVEGFGAGWATSRGHYFDLANGVIGSQFGTGVLGGTMEHLGGGVYKCSVVLVATNNLPGGASAWVATGDGVKTYDGDGSSYIYFFGLQLQPFADRGFNPYGIINTLDTDWYAFDTPANPHFQRHVSDGFGNILTIDRRVHVKNAVLGSDLEGMRGYTADPQGLLADNFNRADRPGITENFGVVNNGMPITSGRLTPSGTAFNFAIHQVPLKTSSQEAEIELISFSSAAPLVGPALCFNDALNQGYFFGVKNFTTGTYRIFHWNGSTVTVIGLPIDTTPPTAPFKVKATIENGIMKGYVNGVEVISRDVAAVVDYTANRRVGFYADSTAMVVDNFKARDI